ncbi:MAG: uracil-DNA glycosylase [Phycisphaerales bacterium]|nr:uracil-DNA glycosylase [Planctomycetota bacterium]MCH8509251.1 uracil-DNA glycosylase [Phycisphaerales bacterium]
MPDRARFLLAQHAETTRLLGVDFLPIGRAPSASMVAVEPEPAPGPEPHPRVEPVQKPAVRAAPAAEIEPKPPTAPIASVRACHEHLEEPQAKLDAVRERYIADAPHQHFVTAHTNIVFGEGDPRARLMFVGEAPGETEDQTGRPFVGRAGQLLEKMINAMGLKREEVYICNVLKTRPPNNATPTSEEARLCAPYLVEQIRIVAPEAIVTLGLPATHLLLETREPMRSARGRWWTFPPTPPAPPGADGGFSGIGAAGSIWDADLPEIPVMPTYHPAYLLRSYTEENRRKVWSDLRLVMDRLGLNA